VIKESWRRGRRVLRHEIGANEPNGQAAVSATKTLGPPRVLARSKPISEAALGESESLLSVRKISR
jgi:hypothetical protein